MVLFITIQICRLKFFKIFQRKILMKMVCNITDLPPELGYQIFKYCSKPDLINLSCCSQSHYECVKYLLYKNVRIPWITLESQIFAQHHLDNLNFATSLRFVSHGLNTLFNKVIWSSICNKYQDIIGMYTVHIFSSS